MLYTWQIPGLYLAYDHLIHIPGLYPEKTLWVCSVPVTYPTGHVIYQTCRTQYKLKTIPINRL